MNQTQIRNSVRYVQPPRRPLLVPVLLLLGGFAVVVAGIVYAAGL